MKKGFFDDIEPSNHVWSRNFLAGEGHYWFRKCSECGTVERWRTIRGYYKWRCKNYHVIEDDVYKEHKKCVICGVEMEQVNRPEPIIPNYPEEEKILRDVKSPMS